MDIRNNIFFWAPLVALYAPSAYSQWEYVIHQDNPSAIVLFNWMLPSLYIAYAYFLGFRFLSALIGFLVLPMIMILVEYMYSYHRTSIYVGSILMTPLFVITYTYFIFEPVFVVLVTISFTLFLFKYFQYLLEYAASNNLNNFICWNILIMPTVVLWSFVLHVNLLFILLFIFVWPAVLIWGDKYILDNYKYDIIILIIILIPPLITIFGYFIFIFPLV